MDKTRSVNLKAAGLGAAVSLLLAAYLASAFGWRQAALFGVGLGAGLVLYHAAFGFTSAPDAGPGSGPRCSCSR
jgi:hypothetical protein